MNKKRKVKKSTVVVGVVVATTLTIVSLVSSPVMTTFESIFRDSVAIVEYYIIKKPLELIGNVFTGYADMKDVYEENEILKNKLDSYEDIIARNELLEQEIVDLKNIMNIDHLRIDYKIQYAAVISRTISGWDNELLINFGSSDGAKTGMPVLDENGMIGVVGDVTELSSTVVLLTQENPVNKIPVQVNSGDEVVFGLLDGYDALNNVYEITLLDTIDQLEEDALVYTSGLGGEGSSPAGIYIGEADELNIRSDGTAIQLTVTPAVDYKDIRHVSIVTTVNTDE